MLKALCIIALLAVTSFADVKAVIDGPSTGNPGDLIVLNGVNSIGDGHRWVIPEGLQTLACGTAGPGQLAFASGRAGSYTFGLIVADKEAAIDYVTHTVKIGGSLPQPPPTDPDQPDLPIPDPDEPDEPDQPTPVPGLEQIEKLSMEKAASLADSTTAKSIAQGILEVDRQIEVMCSRGQCPGLASVKQMMVATIEGRLLGRRGASLNVNWLDGWRKPINEAINKLNAVDVPSYRAIMRAVAVGLSQ
jgi:hypothetical protein